MGDGISETAFQSALEVADVHRAVVVIVAVEGGVDLIIVVVGVGLRTGCPVTAIFVKKTLLFG